MGLILIAGMRRSGSTVAFQIAIALAGGYDSNLGFTDVSLGPNLPETIPITTKVVKTHSYQPHLQDDIRAGRVCVINTYRDPRDITVSMMNFQKRPFHEVMQRGLVKHAVHHQQLWEKSVSANRHDARYEDWNQDLGSLVHIVARAAGIEVSDKKADKLADMFSSERNRIRASHAVNMRRDLLSPGHITDGREGQWQGQLSGQQLEQIYEFAGDWMRDRAYL